ncbi:molybdopterin synthase catalytic subunit-like [Branchiostoma floridae]|uniref:Molybdopterin synthase catalytic subunit n=1 Tax=Branchiostoma floridae TaxID=7739 RepID=A0A9J7HTP2_BRAFL|nr:molybdopterin synthase catalytic subunit-like [Branchiostoma floridae]XP_035664200.1 molybdopterin synthase catalytic subunit-like [Branchiostoma floridae]
MSTVQGKDHIKLTTDQLSVEELTTLVTSPTSGAISVFIGTTRNNFAGKTVLRLEYEAYEAMAETELRKICAQIRERWEVENIAVFHRLGCVPITESSVIIAISSPHRTAGLEAVRYAIDTLKATVPIWKKELYEEGNPTWKENKECSWSS